MPGWKSWRGGRIRRNNVDGNGEGERGKRGLTGSRSARRKSVVIEQTSDDDQIGNLGPEHPLVPLTSARSWLLTRSQRAPTLCFAAARSA